MLRYQVKRITWLFAIAFCFFVFPITGNYDKRKGITLEQLTNYENDAIVRPDVAYPVRLEVLKQFLEIKGLVNNAVAKPVAEHFLDKYNDQMPILLEENENPSNELEIQEGKKETFRKYAIRDTTVSNIMMNRVKTQLSNCLLKEDNNIDHSGNKLFLGYSLKEDNNGENEGPASKVIFIAGVRSPSRNERHRLFIFAISNVAISNDSMANFDFAYYVMKIPKDVLRTPNLELTLGPGSTSKKQKSLPGQDKMSEKRRK